MVARIPVNRILATLALVGVVAVCTGVMLGIGAGRSVAEAVPVGLPEGTLGVGDQLVAPIGPEPDLAGVVRIAPRPTAASLTTTAALAAAPIPRPVVRRAAVRRTAPRAPRAASPAKAATAPSVAAASTGGWKSARASWYGPGFYGRKTASGAVYTQTMMNVAHKSLPFGTRIEFSYGGRSCIAVVNDRGPFVAGRVFDLGAATAKALGFSGVQTVKYRILGR